MSRLMCVEFRDVGFWAFDVVAATYIRFLVDTAEARATSESNTWLADVIHNWRVSAAVSDVGFHLDDSWTEPQVKTVVEIFRKTNEKIAPLGDIPARTVDSAPIVDELHIFLRNIDPIPHRPLLRFGKAVIDLLSGSLSAPPTGHWWCYDLAETVSIIKMDDP